MKNTLLLLILFPVVCFCQKDTTKNKKDTSGYYILGDTHYTSHGISTIFGGFGNEEYKPKQDTIPVIMLVCDTIGYPHISIGFLIPRDQAYNEGRTVWWQFGYKVYEPYTTQLTFSPFDKVPNSIYLDTNKKSLPKSIVVWISKEIK
jgi:hypothetical protein